MIRKIIFTKVFAVLILFFVNVLPTQAQTVSGHVIPEGTKIKLRMDVEINSGSASANDTFITKIAEPVKVNDNVILPVGLIVEGKVIRSQPAGLGAQNGKLEISFHKIRFPDGTSRSINGELTISLKPPSTVKRSALTIIGGSAAGLTLGALVGGKQGGIGGAGLGLGIGTATVLLRKGKDITIPSGKVFEIKLNESVTLPVFEI